MTINKTQMLLARFYICTGLMMASLFASTFAFAAGGYYCASAKNKDNGIFISSGRLPVLKVLRATAQLDEKRWSTMPQTGETAMVFGQGLLDENQVIAEFTDSNIEKIIISLQIDLSKEIDAEGGYRGSLVFIGHRRISVRCELE